MLQQHVDYWDMGDDRKDPFGLADVTARQYDLLRMTPGIDPGILNRLEAEFRRSADGPSAALPVVREGVASGSWSPALGAPAAGATPAQ